jgi:hypothetical protein
MSGARRADNIGLLDAATGAENPMLSASEIGRCCPQMFQVTSELTERRERKMSPYTDEIALAAVADLLHKPAGTAYSMARAGRLGSVKSPSDRRRGLTVSLHALRERFGSLYDLSDEAVAAASARHERARP